MNKGEFVGLVGPNGSGKSTLLLAILGVLKLKVGTVSIYGHPSMSRKLNGKIGWVSQAASNLPKDIRITVRELVQLGTRNSSNMFFWNTSKQNEAVDKAIKMVGLENVENTDIARLSGGQRQRVALGRAIVRNPQAFLMDEPLSNLDALLRLQTRKELIELTGELKSTVIYVTHDQVEAMTMGHRLAVMNKGEVVQLDTPENIFSRPSSRFVAEFIGSPPMNFLQVEIVEKNKKRIFQQDSFEVPVPDSMKALKEKSVILGFRPNELELVSRGGISGTVSV
ncbi:MAG: ABC transporter ATP-binding protein, partial [SAR324 cluster bacterium]|nr:ABC transporter ATP-binding protein [SAR324 cluster bacterium]